MKKMLFFFTVLLLLLIVSSNAHNLKAKEGGAESKRNCTTEEYFQKQIKENPSRLQKYEEINKKVKSLKRTITGVMRIPVVVHIVWNTPEQNISDDAVYSQIDVLNRDFRRLNSDANNIWAQAADSEIEFYLANSDPDCFLTTGITRTFTFEPYFIGDNSMKFTSTGGIDAWDTTKYINIWVVNFDPMSGILSYSQFPGNKHKNFSF